MLMNSSDAGDGIFRLWDQYFTMTPDALVPKVATSAGMVLAGKDRQHVLLFQGLISSTWVKPK